ncbi:MAG: ABC transporter ATP-binding protein [Lachnospiraceae bacterium]|nr:ABC transporter ATP-binding protein [Lachnospiraceae bacterium]
MKLVLEQLTKIFPGREKKNPKDVRAVSEMSLTIEDGELVGLLGPSGCGKSTALNLICGLEAPTSGRVYFGEEDVTDLGPEHRGVGLVFQNYALYPHMTVRQNIRFPLENLKGAQKLTKEEVEERVQEAARIVQIEELLERKPAEMSGGQQQRVAIARALVKKPNVLLLDEPLSNLDARLRLQTREEIKRIQRKTGVTSIFVTHDQEEAMSISDRIVVMKAGVVQQCGRPQEVYDRPANLFVAQFLGTPRINTFEGRVKGGKLFIGEDELLKTSAPDGEYSVGIRPEGLLVDDAGSFHCGVTAVEVMGRDTSVVFTHAGSGEEQLRAIVPGGSVASDKKEQAFSVKPDKIFLFDKESGERVELS